MSYFRIHCPGFCRVHVKQSFLTVEGVSSMLMRCPGMRKIHLWLPAVLLASLFRVFFFFFLLKQVFLEVGFFFFFMMSQRSLIPHWFQVSSVRYFFLFLFFFPTSIPPWFFLPSSSAGSVGVAATNVCHRNALQFWWSEKSTLRLARLRHASLSALLGGHMTRVCFLCQLAAWVLRGTCGLLTKK